MIEERTYSEAISKERALENLKENAGSQFDPNLTEKFIEIIDNKSEDEYNKIVTLKSKAEADILESLLAKKDISYEIHSYYDQIYDGIFISQHDWGYLRAAEEDKEKISSLYTKVSNDLNENKIFKNNAF
jgi:adenosine deaminase